MKISKDKELMKKAAAFYDLKMRANLDQKLLNDLRSELMAAMKDQVVAVGEYVMLVSERQRVDLDKKALVEALGEDIHQYEKKSTFSIFEVKKA